MLAHGTKSEQMEDNLWMAEIPDVVETLQKGAIVLYPTDTIWGLGCDALNEKAIDKIYKIKKRPQSAPLIVLVDGVEMLKEYVPRLHPRIETLLSVHSKPLTIVYSGVKGLPGVLYSPKKTVGIRVTSDPFCQEMIRHFGRPVISTSANVSGQPWPKGFGEISSEIIRASSYVVRHRREEKQTGEPSVVASYNSKGMLQFIRE
jgi:L-threonylcarbamoyladenylate synthase